MRSLMVLTTSILVGTGSVTIAAKQPVTPPKSPLSYADMADLAFASDIVAEVRPNKVSRVDGKAMPLPENQRRYLVNATVTALIRGKNGLAPRISYLADGKADSLGKFPAIAKRPMMVFAVPVANRPAEIRLVAPDGQQPLSPDLADTVRKLLAEANLPGAPPRILRVGDAFHVPGTVAGEGETQIFLVADDGRPLSLSIWREPGQAPRWAVSLGEIVDEGAAPPARNTLLWYRLACFLPRTLPALSTDALNPDSARIAMEDYATVMTGLGNCPRTRKF